MKILPKSYNDCRAVVGPGQIFVARVGSGLKIPNFSIFSSDGSGQGQKVPGSASYLLRVKSKLGSGWVRAHTVLKFLVKHP